MKINNIQSSHSYNNLENVKNTKENLPKEAVKVQEVEEQNLLKNELTQDKKKLKDSLEDIIEGLNEMARIFNRSLEFAVHEDTHRVMVKVVDTETDEVIREIPPEELLNLAAKMQETFSFLVDVRA